MTSTAPFMPRSMGLPVPKTQAMDQPASVRLGLKQGQDHRLLCWLVAITACFLAVGVVGLFEEEEWMPVLLSGTKGHDKGEKEAMKAVMVDLQTQEVAAETTVEEQPVEVLEVPPPVDVAELPEDLPELAEALVTEDVFVIPTPPRIENALRPVEPTPEKPRPKPKLVASSAPRSAVASSSARGSAGAASTPGGSGGAGSSGVGASRGSFTFPKPTYLSHFRSMGARGTVKLMISVGASGRAESVSVIGSCGNSELDAHGASWVRRNGHGPAGPPGKVIATLVFKLN